MRKGPNGERRSGDVVQRAHQVFQIAIGEAKDNVPTRKRKSGIAGATARASVLSAERRKEIAHKAASARWR
jgi:hypothetical protein